MKMTFLTGELALRARKTGVHTVHNHLLREAAKDGYMGYEAQIACFVGKKTTMRKNPLYVNEPYADRLRFSSRLSALLAYFLPLECMFGRSDLYFCDGLVPITLHRAKKVGIIHDLMVKIYPGNYSLISLIYLNCYFNRCKKCDRIVTVSESTKRDIVRFLGVDAEKISVIGCGFDPPKPLSAEEAARVKTDIDFSQRYLFFIGDMRKNKNLLSAIKAVENVCAHTQIKFYIAGAKKDEYSTLSDYVKEHGLENNVIFLGYISNAEKALLYQNAAALLFVSDYEGFGIPILEGASYGIPVITSNTSSMKEIAEGYAVTVDPHSISEIAAAIEEVLVPETRERLALRQKAMIEKYTWEHTYLRFKQAIRSTPEP